MSAALFDAVGDVIEANGIRARQLRPAAGRQEIGPEINERFRG